VNVTDVLDLATDDVGSLRAPVMLIGLTGLFDIGGAATTAVDRMAPADHAITVGEIDPDPFYDFTQERPYVEFDEGEVRVIRWPENRFDVVRGRGDRDLVVLVGVEPHLAWRTYAECVIHVARELRCEAVVTVGSSAEPVPHTRTPLVNGSTTDPALARSLGIGQPSYQGMTGVIGVIQTALGEVGIPSISLRVGIPHYLMNTEHPQAIAALQTHLSHVLNVPVPDDHGDLVDEIGRARALHDEVVANDPQLQMYVRMLEADFDRTAEAAIPSPDDLGAELERFLDEQRNDD
jgi:hypothetical protein